MNCLKDHDKVNKNVKVIFVCSQVEYGHVECVMDKELHSAAIEVEGRNME